MSCQTVGLQHGLTPNYSQRAAVLWRHSSPSLLWDISIPLRMKWNPISLVEQTNFETLNVILWGEQAWGKNHFIRKQNHITTSSFLTNTLPTLPGTLPSSSPCPRAQHRTVQYIALWIFFKYPIILVHQTCHYHDSCVQQAVHAVRGERLYTGILHFHYNMEGEGRQTQTWAHPNKQLCWRCWLKAEVKIIFFKWQYNCQAFWCYASSNSPPVYFLSW